MRPMITNGGTHPADKWADVTVETILDLLVDGNPDSVTPQALAARQAKRELTPKLFAILNAHHAALQSAEISSPQPLGSPIDILDDALATLGDINAALAETPFADHFALPNTQAVLLNIIGQHSTDVVHIERRWAADKKVA